MAHDRMRLSEGAYIPEEALRRSPPHKELFIIDSRMNDSFEGWILLVAIPPYTWEFRGRFSREISSTAVGLVSGELRAVLSEIMPSLVRWVPKDIAVPMLAELIDRIVRGGGRIEPTASSRELPRRRTLGIGEIGDDAAAVHITPTFAPKKEHPDAWIDKAVRAMKGK